MRKSKNKIGFDIVKKTTGEVVGHSDTKGMALSSVRARYAKFAKDEGKKIMRGYRA